MLSGSVAKHVLCGSTEVLDVVDSTDNIDASCSSWLVCESSIRSCSCVCVCCDVSLFDLSVFAAVSMAVVGVVPVSGCDRGGSGGGGGGGVGVVGLGGVLCVGVGGVGEFGWLALFLGVLRSLGGRSVCRHLW